ncbi:ESPR domain-containing protein, partial [Cronobacter sakazakii]
MKRSLNCSYRLVWSEVQRAFIVVSELTRAKGKRASGAVLLTAAVGSSLASGGAFAFTPDVTSSVQDELVQNGTQQVLVGGTTTNHIIGAQGNQIVAGGLTQKTTLNDGG